jgi:3-oxoacyl-ACP reductase-like protein
MLAEASAEDIVDAANMLIRVTGTAPARDKSLLELATAIVIERTNSGPVQTSLEGAVKAIEDELAWYTKRANVADMTAEEVADLETLAVRIRTILRGGMLPLRAE